jgi:hypothetical protein
MTLLRSAVCSSEPCAPTVPQGAGTHAALAVVRGREEMLFVMCANVTGLSAACPSIVREAAAIVFVLHWNWM